MKTKSKKQPQKASLAIGVDLTEMGQLVDFLSKHGLEEFEYSKGGVHIRVKRPSGNSAQGNFHSFPAPEILYPPSSPPTGAAAQSSPSGRESASDTQRAEDLHLVKSPIVGTFYGSPSPGSEPFVKVGDHVNAGQPLCIIEAMKLMNEIESEVSGEVLKVFVENGQPVEYGESLFGIRPTHRK